ncbi:hypothetical protein U9M48_038144 [Paspalum notatum var. saurae]|uniref:Uncharacterized protein n=1 Tax=Paspalum notatum var. saurae TaxID=547442 RepID=A0AAQ3UKS9_PASNO
MSRCFPFPPPGYEARPRIEEQHEDLLKKGKHKEKKHRKEKDRGKGERKEKDRDHRKDKHKKKHKRGKRGEGSKNKDRYKDKNQTLGQETQKKDHGNITSEARGQHESVKYIKPTSELATRIFGQESHTNHKYNNTRELLPWSTDSIDATDFKGQERNSLGRRVQKSAQATHVNHGMVQKGDSISHDSKKGMSWAVDYKTKIKNGKSLQDGSAEVHSKSSHICKGVSIWHHSPDTQRSSEGVHTASSVVSGSTREANGRTTPSPGTWQRTEEMGQDPDISVHSAKAKNDSISTKAMMGREKQSANNFRGKMGQQFARNKDVAVKGRAKSNYVKCIEGKDRDSIVKKRKTEYKNKVKEVKKTCTVNEQKHKDLCAFRASKDKVDNLMLLDCLNDQKLASDDMRKRKDFDTNSSPNVDTASPSLFPFSERNMRTSKLPRMSPTNLTCADEKMSQHPQETAHYSSTELVGANNCDIGLHEHQERYNNGITDSRYSEEHAPSVSSSCYESNAGYPKQTHPDTKYLSQVHSIPSTPDFSEYIDQGWLFSEDNVERKTERFEAAESCQVWSDAQLIGTADVIALPYVVPL